MYTRLHTHTHKKKITNHKNGILEFEDSKVNLFAPYRLGSISQKIKCDTRCDVRCSMFSSGINPYIIFKSFDVFKKIHILHADNVIQSAAKLFEALKIIHVKKLIPNAVL